MFCQYAYLISGELATLLSGRYVEIESLITTNYTNTASRRVRENRSAACAHSAIAGMA